MTFEQHDNIITSYCVRDGVEKHGISTLRLCMYRYRPFKSMKMMIWVENLQVAGRARQEVAKDGLFCIEKKTRGPGHGRS